MTISDVQYRWCGSDGRPPVDPFEQHRKLCRRERYSSAGRLGPYEPASFQPLRQQAQAITVEPQHLHHVAATATKDKDMTRQRLLLEHALYLSAQAMKAAAHIGYACRNPDARACGKRNHGIRLFSTAWISAASTVPSTLTSARPGNSI